MPRKAYSLYLDNWVCPWAICKCIYEIILTQKNTILLKICKKAR